MTFRYFRHPFLHVGQDTSSSAARFEKFLAARGYTVAPVTMDNDDFVYAAAYTKHPAPGAMRPPPRASETITFGTWTKFSRFSKGFRGGFSAARFRRCSSCMPTH